MNHKRMHDPEGKGLADDLIGNDPIPDDVERFDERGYPIPKPNRDTKPDETPTPKP